MYDSTIHCAAPGLAPSWARTIGSAALTTEPSMNVMLEARIVVPRTAHAPDSVRLLTNGRSGSTTCSIGSLRSVRRDRNGRPEHS